MRLFLTSILVLFSIKICVSQNITIDDKMNNYFLKDRENIFLHLNKDVFLSNEKVWFKAYIMDYKTNLLNFNSTNVFVRLLDNKGTEIENQLYLAKNGIIEGYFTIPEDIRTGDYFLNAYTNYMNNFEENESSYFKIKLINNSNPSITKFNDSTLNCKVSFEGESFCLNTNNNVVATFTNCIGEGVKINDIEVIDCDNQTVCKFSTNSNGIGRFNLNSPKNCQYKIIVNNSRYNFSKTINNPSVSAVKIHANNIASTENLFIQILTNDFYLKNNAPHLKLLIRQKNLGKIININLNETIKELSISKKELNNGISILTLLDDKNNKLSERIVYIQNQPKNSVIKKVERKGDSLYIYGNTSTYSSLSFSSISANNLHFYENNINSTLKFNNILDTNFNNYNYYFNDYNRKHQFEFDTFLITCEPKHKWKNILTKNISDKYPFDLGLTVKGKINNFNPKDKNKILKFFNASYGIDLKQNVNEKGEFKFENIVVYDSTKYYFSLLNEKEKYKNLGVYSTVENNVRKFLKPFPFKTQKCNEDTNQSNLERETFDYKLPSFRNVIQLDSINLTVKKGPKFENKGVYGTNMADAYKISDNEIAMYQDVLGFIQGHGFDVSRFGAEINIVARTTKSVMGSNTPAIYLDRIPLTDFSQLIGMLLIDVDEIYINKHGYGGGMNAHNGIINIFTKKSFGKSADVIIKSKDLILKNGFQEPLQYKNPKYNDYFDDAFKNFGTIHWEPNIYSEKNGDFIIKTPHFYQEKIKISIQGINMNGELIYYENIISVN